jgi:hypothetical protein
MHVGLIGGGTEGGACLQSFDMLNDAGIIAVRNPDKTAWTIPENRAVLSIFGPSCRCRLSST